jgi:predicted metal-dependent enzyme (double-stranded beta helix superfamily)
MLRMRTSECQIWLKNLNVAGAATSESVLHRIASELSRLGGELDWGKMQVSQANPGEERLYLLAQLGQDGPTLYLVSDGAGTMSAAHEHQTWAAIAGLRGVERNVLYEVTSQERREARRSSVKDIGAGDCIVLTKSVVHSTKVVGAEATFHLHLYGRPLHSLPPFEDRVFRDEA